MSPEDIERFLQLLGRRSDLYNLMSGVDTVSYWTKRFRPCFQADSNLIRAIEIFGIISELKH